MSDTDYEKIIVERDDEADLVFTGVQIAHVDNDPMNQQTRWTELTLYQAENGKYICQVAHKTRWEGEHHSYKAEVCDNYAEIIEYFGYGRLAKKLYKRAHIDATLDVATMYPKV
jgi:hypothetical protein